MTHACFRCGSQFNHPIDENANYIRGEDTKEKEAQEAYYAMMHTDETLAELDRLDKELPDRNRQAIAAEAAHPDADASIEVTDNSRKTVENEDGSTVETATSKQVDFSIPTEKFKHVEVESPNVVQHDDMVALTYTNVEEREVQKTGLVCSDCLTDTDDVIWGPDAE